MAVAYVMIVEDRTNSVVSEYTARYQTPPCGAPSAGSRDSHLAVRYPSYLTWGSWPGRLCNSSEDGIEGRQDSRLVDGNTGFSEDEDRRERS